MRHTADKADRGERVKPSLARSWLALASPTETRRIGRYLLGPEIAAGAASVVHLGLLDGAEGFRRAVAIKRLHAGHRSPRAFTALRREAVISASVRHPHTIAVLDLVHEAGELFVVMEHVLGDDLAQLLTVVAPLPARVAVRIALDVLSALNAVHSACSPSGHSLQLLHRDVSPQNILIGVDGAARLTDFGVARCLSDDAITVVGAVKGATGYVAPELASGGPIDARTDVFAAAVVLWEMLTGKRLFKHVIAADALASAIERGIKPPSELNPRVPTRLDDVVLRALSGAPDNRPNSARAFAVDLASALEAAPHEEVADFLRAHLRKSLAIQEAQLRALQAVRPTIQLTPPLALMARLAGQPVIVEGKTAVTSPSTEAVAAPVLMASPALDEATSASVVTAPSWRSERARAARQACLRPGWTIFFVGLAIAIFTLFWSTKRKPLPAVRPTPASGRTANTPSKSPEPELASSLSAPEVPAPILGEPTAAALDTVAVEPPAPSVLPTSIPVRARRLTTSHAKKPAGAAAHCAEPFVVDARGIKRVRPECY